MKDKIKLEIGKNYEGHMDGSFEIVTIDNELYLIPKTNCIVFKEQNDSN